MELISYLNADHKIIRRLMNDLDVTEGAKIHAQFLELDQAISAHFKAEEIALYAASLKMQMPELIDFAIKGFEEHSLFDDLSYKIKYSGQVDLLASQIKVFCQVLEMHLTEEENDYFPQIEKFFSNVELERAAVLYLKIKKSELVRLQQNKNRRIEKEIQLTT